MFNHPPSPGAPVIETMGISFQDSNQNLPQGWAMKYKDKVVVVPDEVIAQIRAAPMDAIGWVEEGLRKAWMSMFPLT